MQRRILNAFSKEILAGFIQKDATMGMMNETDEGKDDIIFYNLDKVVPVLE